MKLNYNNSLFVGYDFFENVSVVTYIIDKDLAYQMCSMNSQEVYLNRLHSSNSFSNFL